MTTSRSRRPALLAALAALVLFPTVFTAPAQTQSGPPAAPAGLTAFAGNARAVLSWRPVSGATYALYRGTSAGSVTTLVTPSGFTGTSYTDTTALSGTTYYYAVRAVTAAGSSPVRHQVRVTPRARTCSSGNAIRVENCFPGTTGWKSLDATRSDPSGIEGYLTASSVNAGGSVDLKVTTDWVTPYRVEIYRTGHYGGQQGRLISVVEGQTGNLGFCARESSTTGLTDCGSWESTSTITTTTAWPSGVYLLKLVRGDNGEHSDVLLVVRRDGSSSDLLYHVPTSTYQAYNVWGGKSMYDYASDGPTTVAGSNRAVHASFDRPYSQSPASVTAHDWYTRADVAAVSWLERQGYDATYIASEDLHTAGGQLTRHDAFVSGVHDEYWSLEMYDAVTAARDAGVGLFFMGANGAYWRVRFVPSAITGAANRIMVGYKSIAGAAQDPSGIATTTWRDPAGPNRPENALLGQMYIGDNASQDFPLRVSASEGRNRLWRYTPLTALAAGTTASIGTSIVGWEWDARVANGREPAGVQTVASSPVTGNLVQNHGAAYTYGNAVANTTVYRAASGAYVFASGTNNWSRGLALNAHGQGEPDNRIAQATINAFADMGVRPTTLQSGLQVDPTGSPSVSSTTPSTNATSVALGVTVTAVYNRELDPATIDAADLRLTAADGSAVAGAVTLDNATRTLSFKPAELLEPNVVYTATAGTNVQGWNGASPVSARTWSFTTGPGSPPTVISRTPDSGATGVFTDTTVQARFDRRLDPATVTPQTFSVRPAAGGAAISAGVSYDATTRTATLTPAARLAPSTQYTAQLTTGIRATDGIAMSAPSSYSFTTGTNVTVSGRFPATDATGISPAAAMRVTFSRAVDAATVTATSVRLTGPGGTVPASVAFDAVTQTATLTPSVGLGLATTYTVSVAGTVRGADGAPADPTSWSFTTAPTAPPRPQVTSTLPASGAIQVPNGSAVKVVFDQAVDPASVTSQSFTLTPAGGIPVAATVTYDAAARRATLTPLAGLQVGTLYTATLTTAVRTSTGAPLASDFTWTFTSAACPCALMTGVTPTWTGIPVRDFRPDPGPWTYELGTRVTVSETAQLVALRFWKEPGETGTHVGRLWSSTGQQLAQVTYQDESASGWQRQALTTPVTLQPGQTYVVSVGLHAFYAKTNNGLAQPLVSGPLQSAPGANGVFASSEGVFPNDTWQSSNYFVDGVVKLPSQPAMTPAVSSRTPVAGATGVPVGTTVRATFTTPMDPSSINGSTFTLTGPSGAVAASVRYDEDTRTAILEPSAPLGEGYAYTARLTTGVRADDETPLPSQVSWSFSTVPPGPPSVTSVSPVAGATDVGVRSAVVARFSQAMDPATITSSSFRLTRSDGSTVPAAVTYDAATSTATLTPSAPLAGGSAYIARLTTAIRSDRDVALTSEQQWTFTTTDCPCRLFDASATPTWTDLDVANGRSGTGPFSLTMGVKIRVTEPTDLQAVSFYKSPNETGTHVGRVFSASGQLLASTTFAGETASGWQTQALSTPLALSPGQTYVVAVTMNRFFVMTSGGLANELARGPLRSVDDGLNGVFGESPTAMPADSWGESNYWIDAVVG